MMKFLFSKCRNSFHSDLIVCHKLGANPFTISSSIPTYGGAGKGSSSFSGSHFRFPLLPPTIVGLMVIIIIIIVAKLILSSSSSFHPLFGNMKYLVLFGAMFGLAFY